MSQSMSFVISFIFFLTSLLFHLILGNHQGQSLSSYHLDQSIDVDVTGGIESGFFLLPASIVTPGAVNVNHANHHSNKNDSTSLSSPSSNSFIYSITSYYSSLSPSNPIFVKATFGTITATETVFPYQGTPAGYHPSLTTTATNKYQPLKSNGQARGKSTNNLPPSPPPPRNILNGAAFREKITDSTLVEIDSGHGKHSIAYLVTPTVTRNSPVVRVLFYTTHPVVHATSIVTSSSGDPSTESKSSTNSKINSKDNENSEDGFHSDERSKSGGLPYEASPCIFVSVSKDGENILGSCTPINNREGACLVEITLPAYWWPPVELDSPKPRKSGSISVDYKTFHTNQCTENGSLSNENIKRLKSLTDAFTHLGQVTLSPFTGTYEEVTNDDIVRILIPQQSTFPNNKIYIPVCFRYNPNYPMTAFRLRARVKSGLRILGVQPSPVSPWKISLEVNSKQTLATVTAQLKDNYLDLEDLQSGDSGIHLLLSQEIYSWLIQVNENVDFSDNGRIVWQLEYVTENGGDSPTMDSSSSIKFRKDSPSATSTYTDRDTSKLSSILDIQKDSVQAVIGITSSLSMINTAVLTGKQVAQSLRVFAVYQSGRLGDVTLQASCTSTDESVVKVSPACTSIYLDGSEIRGSSNATIAIKYGTYTGSANFIIWVPKLPLEVRVSDGKLSQIKGWKIPHSKREGRRSYHHHHHSHHQNSIYGSDEHKSRRSSSFSTAFNDNLDFTSTDSDFRCRLRHQQAYINVYARFFSTDHNSGRESYLLNRKVLVQITKLVTPFLRVTDNRVALIRSNIIEGISPGRSEIQIVSPINANQILGSTEIYVDSEKETISSLQVNLVTGLSLTIKPEPSLPNVFKIVTNISSRLVNQYQEGLLNIKIHFSDSSVTSLADITDSDYQLSVNTADNGGLAYAPLIGQPYPRVIAIGQGNSQLTISLEVSDQCQRKRTQPLAVSQINANIDLNLPTGHLQNDADFRKYNGILVHRNHNSFQQSSNHHSDGDDVDIDNDGDHLITTYGVGGQSSNPENHNSNNNAPSIEARSNRAISPSELTPLEVGMYSLLGVFTLAVSLFIFSCFVFRLKGKQASSDPMVATLPLPGGHHSLAHHHHRQGGSSNQKVVANANDWIWLGKATLQRNSPPSSAVKPKSNKNEATQGLISLNDLKNRDGSHRHHLDVTPAEDDGSNRMSTISYPGSEISIRITTNPVEEACLDHQDATPKPSTPFGINKEIERFYRSISPAVPAKVNASTSSSIPPPVPGRRTKGYSSATHSPHIVPPVPPPIPLHQHSHREHFSTHKNDPIIIPNHKPPHIPPRLTRSIRCDQIIDSSSSLSSSYTSHSPRPPPVPPHSVTTRTTKKPPLPPHRTVSTKFKRPSVTSKTLSNNIKMNGQHELLLPSSSSSSSSASKSCHNNNTKDHSNINRLINIKSNQETINHSSIIVNPSSTLTQLTQENLNRVTKEMNYNQLMEYFQNLKESSA